MKSDTKSDNIKRQSFRRKYIIAAGFLLLLIMPVLIFILLSQNQKPDPPSEATIRRAAAVRIFHDTGLIIDPNKLTDEDFAKITIFTLEKEELSDIKLLKKFTNLEVLQLSNIKYPESKIPKWMKTLEKFGIIKTKDRSVIDLTPLVKLTHLKKLSLASTSVKNIKPLSNLSNLETLSLTTTSISDLEPIKGLVNLQSLRVPQTHISDLKPVTRSKKSEVFEFY